jgi:hypothetical protein
VRASRRLVHGGAVLRGAGCTLRDYGVRDGATVFEVKTLLGGGGDGGTTASQRKFNVQHRVRKVDGPRDLTDEQRARWHHCAASGQPLREPIVACELGYIFSKEEVMKQLLGKTLHSNLSHIRKMKDLFPIKLEQSPEFDESKSNAKNDEGSADRCARAPLCRIPAHSCPPDALTSTCACCEQIHLSNHAAPCQREDAVCRYQGLRTCRERAIAEAGRRRHLCGVLHALSEV